MLPLSWPACMVCGTRVGWVVWLLCSAATRATLLQTPTQVRAAACFTINLVQRVQAI